jgi:hypothetical protein
MLKIVRQIESGEKTSIRDAFNETTKNVLRIIIISLIWAVIWFIILVIESIFRSGRSNEKKKISARDVARTLGGADSQKGIFGKLSEDAIRMFIFLTLPIIAWENKGIIYSFNKSTEILKKHPMQFLTAYVLTEFGITLIALPLIPIFFLDQIGHSFSTTFWIVIILYTGFVWTLNIYLEQMSAGLFYLWHKRWENKGGKGDLSKVNMPDLLDNIYEFKLKN